MKKCPFCAEDIKDEAIVCRYCGRDLPTPGVPVPVVKTKIPVQVSIWKQGAKTSTVITILYAIYTFFISPNPAELMGSLTIGLIATFLFWWLVSASVIWVLRKLGNNSILKVLVIILVAIAIFYLSSLVSSGRSSLFISPTVVPTYTQIPTKAPTKQNSNCLSWEQIDKTFAGKMICVSGIVYEIKQVKVKGEYLTITQDRIYFSENKNALFLLDDQYSYPNLKNGDCVVANGKIEIDSKHVPFINLKGELKNCNPNPFAIN